MAEKGAGEKSTPLSETELQTVYHSVNDAIFVHDKTGEIIDVNQAAAEMYGYSRAELRDSDIETISSGEPPYTQETAQKRARRAANGESLTFEWQGEDSEGAVFWEEVSLSRAVIDGEIRILAIVRNIDERKQAEQQIEAQRDSLEVLNRVVRHDIRNKLQLVQIYADMLQANADLEDEETLEKVSEAASDAVDITTNARDVTDVMLQSDSDCHPVPLRTVIENEIDNVRSSHQNALIRVEDSISETMVFADNMLESVFRNLLTNAIQHNDKETPEVTVSATVRDGTVTVRVADNGPGIPDARKDKIFEQGEMSLDSQGTGLGLYLVDTLIDRYGGAVRATDNDPRGAMFVVELPLADTEPTNKESG